MKHYRTVKGTLCAYWLSTVVSIAAFMSGYDSGVAGGVLTMKSFRDDYNYSDADITFVNSLSVSLQLFGAFLACFIIFPITERIGRKKAILLAAVVFLVGSTMETINTHQLHIWYAGRLLAGLGQGGCSVIVPMYSAEMSPTEIRGKLGSMYQWMFTIGILVAYWTDYSVVRKIPATTKQWQIPVGMQLIGGGLLFLGTFTLKESVRWLVKKGRNEEAFASLVWVRGDDSSATDAEFEEIKAGVHRENMITKGVRRRDLFVDPANRYRVFLASMVFFFQQGAGGTALAYFAPQFFQLLVGPGNKDLMLTAVFGAVKVVSCTIFIFLIADRFGRQNLLIGGGFAMSICMVSIAMLYKFIPPSGDGNITPGSIMTIILIYVNVSAYNWSWGTLPWAYVPEIFPTRIREIGVALGMSVHWGFSFLFSSATPYMIRDLGWGTFLLYAGIDAAMTVFAWFCIKETAGKSLEDLDDIFEHQIDGQHGAVNKNRRAEEEEALHSTAASSGVSYGTFVRENS